MKEKKSKKIVAGLASTLIFFGKNVYATSETTTSGGKIGFIVGVALILAVLGLGYRMDKKMDSDERKTPKAKKEKSHKINPKINDKEESVKENDIPYESEKNEIYESEKMEMQDDIYEAEEYEEDSLFSTMEDDRNELNKGNMDSTMVFNMKEDDMLMDAMSSTMLDNEEEKTEESSNAYEFSYLNEKIDELDELDDFDEKVINDKMAELVKNDDTVEDPEEFLNSLKKYEQNVEEFAGFSVSETTEKQKEEEISSFSFGNNMDIEESNEIDKNIEDTPDFSNLSTEKNDFNFSKETSNFEDNMQDDSEETTTELDTGFLNQMEKNLMKHQEERLKGTKDKNN